MSVVLAAASFALLLSRGAPSPRPGPPVRTIARLTSAGADVRRRPAQTLVWETLSPGAELHDADTLFVPPSGDAEVVFLDGTRLELDENSLVVLEAPRDAAPSVALKQGSVSGRTAADRLHIQSELGSASFQQHTEGRMDLEPGEARVEVFEGLATIATPRGEQPVRSRQQASLRGEAGAEVTLAPPVELQLPARNQRIAFRGAPDPVLLRWASTPEGTSARLQLARDRTFGFRVFDGAAKEDRFFLEAPEAGVYWWRLVDDRGKALSEARRFTLIEDLPPRPLTPRAMERVWSTAAQPAQFAWSAVRGASTYRLEVSTTPGFEALAFSAPANRVQLATALALPEGTYYWRVRAEDTDRAALPSRAVPFQLLHKPLPQAPLLFSPELEVEPGAR